MTSESGVARLLDSSAGLTCWTHWIGQFAAQNGGITSDYGFVADADIRS